jgi:hypothetical protein
MPMVLLDRPSAFVVKDFVEYKYGFSHPTQAARYYVLESTKNYGRPKRPPGPEAILHMAWRNAGLERAQVRGRDRHTYSIVYGGKPGGSLGPDFTDAVIERDDGTTYRGDIEIHVRESDWRAHGHHTDPRYNGVVLHVVAAESAGRPALKATGSTIPLLALNWKKPTQQPPRVVSIDNEISTEAAAPRTSPLLALPVAEAGLERFHSQASGIALDIEAFGAVQAIWLGVLGALGYPRNKRAFRAVAGRVDWQSASMCVESLELQHLLLQASGLTESTNETIRKVQLKGTAPNWVRPFGRPANAPPSRIKAISALVQIWIRQGGLARSAEIAVTGVNRPKELALMFRPTELVEDDAVTTLGLARASEIAVNVLLPAVFAMATRSQTNNAKLTGLKNRALELYSQHPKLAGNSLVKEAEIALSIDHSIPKIATARDQQGLIALYREMFRRGIRSHQPRLPGV